LRQIDPNPITSASDIITRNIYDRKEGGSVLLMKLNDKGGIAWSKATNKWIGKRLGFNSGENRQNASFY
jgi:hypothetical protein